MQSSLSDPGLVPDLAPGLIRLASRLAGASDAEDLVQATWVRALEHHGSVKDHRPWLRQVLVNEQRMRLRGRRRRDEREQSQREVHDDPPDLEDIVHCLEVARIVDDLLGELDDDVQLVVRERYFGGDSAAEIARRHRIPAGTVRWRLKSGLDHLRDRLDARYGGRRALWAGGFAPASIAPTLLGPVASPPSTAGHTSTAAAKGLSAMSVKILLAAGLTATAGGVAWVASSEPEPEPVVTTAAQASAPADDSAPATRELTPPVAVEEAAPKPTRAVVAPSATERAKRQAQWASRRSKIQAAQAAQPAQPDAPEGMSWHAAGSDVAIPLPHEGEHVFCESDEECPDGLAEQIVGMVEGCKDFMGHADPSLSLAAHVIGAPDVGFIVESVELSSGDDAPEDLRECLTESMYTLDLGPTDRCVDKTLRLTLADAPVNIDALADAELDEQTRAALEEALARGDKAHMMFLEEGE